MEGVCRPYPSLSYCLERIFSFTHSFLLCYALGNPVGLVTRKWWAEPGYRGLHLWNISILIHMFVPARLFSQLLMEEKRDTNKSCERPLQCFSFSFPNILVKEITSTYTNAPNRLFCKLREKKNIQSLVGIQFNKGLNPPSTGAVPHLHPLRMWPPALSPNWTFSVVLYSSRTHKLKN